MSNSFSTHRYARNLFSVFVLVRLGFGLGPATAPIHAQVAGQNTSAAPTQQAATPTERAGKKVSDRQANAAEAAYLEGAKSFKAGGYAAAERHFLRAIQLNPQKSEYVLGVTLARQHRVATLLQQAAAERQSAHPQLADALLQQARLLDPTNPLVQQHDASIEGVLPLPHQQIAGELQLQPNAGKQSFHLRGNTTELLLQVAARYGIRATFDTALTVKSLRLDLDEVSYEQAMSIAGLMAGVIAVPLDEKTVIIANDTQENRDRLERQIEETLYLPGLSTEELNDVGNVVRNVFEVKQATVQPGKSTLVVRAPAATLVAVNRTLDDLMDGGSEVLVRLQIYSVSNQKTRDTGLTPPQALSVFSPAGVASTLISQNQAAVNQLIASGVLGPNPSQVAIALALLASGIGNSTLLSGAFLKFGGGLTTAVVSAGNSPTIHLLLNTSDTRTLDDIQLRMSDRQTGTFRSGSRYPITTSTFSSGVSSSNASVNNLISQYLGSSAKIVTIPQIQFEDLGITLKATPHVLRGGDITVHIELKIEALAGAALNNIPILSSRQSTSDVTMRAGETALMSSLVSRTEASAIDGTPGLSELPGFQSVTDRNRNEATEELVMLLTPILVRRGHLNLAGPYTPLRVHANN